MEEEYKSPQKDEEDAPKESTEFNAEDPSGEGGPSDSQTE